MQGLLFYIVHEINKILSGIILLFSKGLKYYQSLKKEKKKKRNLLFNFKSADQEAKRKNGSFQLLVQYSS